MLKYTAQYMSQLSALPTSLLATKVNLLSQQIRNTYVLKRRTPPGLHKKNYVRHTLKSRHFVYDLVENTLTKKRPQIEIILTQNIKNVGVAGDRITTTAEKAYNNFLLPKLAVYCTPENIEKYSGMSLQKDVGETVFSSSCVESTLTYLSHLELCILMSKEVPWTLEKWHVRATFRKAGIIVPEDAITMPAKKISGPDTSIEQKLFLITVTINNCEQLKVKCKIYHWHNDPLERVIHEKETWNRPQLALFPEEQELIESLPKFIPPKNKKK